MTDHDRRDPNGILALYLLALLILLLLIAIYAIARAA